MSRMSHPPAVGPSEPEISVINVISDQQNQREKSDNYSGEQVFQWIWEFVIQTLYNDNIYLIWIWKLKWFPSPRCSQRCQHKVISQGARSASMRLLVWVFERYFPENKLSTCCCLVWEIENLINIKVFSSNTSSWTNMRSVRLGTLIQKYQILEKLLLVKGYFCVFLLCVWWILNEWVCANNILIFSWDELLLSRNI